MAGWFSPWGGGAAPPHDSGTAADLQSPGWTIGSGGGKEGVGASWHLPGWSREGEKEEGAWGGVRYGAPGGGGGGGGGVQYGTVQRREGPNDRHGT
jgi:hypothetical protein